jgi:hypothetical protein
VALLLLPSAPKSCPLHSTFSNLALPTVSMRPLSGLGRTGTGFLRGAGCVTLLRAPCHRDRNEGLDCGLFMLPSLLLLQALLPLTTDDVFVPQEGLRPFFLRFARMSSSPALWSAALPIRTAPKGQIRCPRQMSRYRRCGCYHYCSDHSCPPRRRPPNALVETLSHTVGAMPS